MSESQQKQGQTRLLLNIVMIILETIYSFILKHDRVVRLQAKKFVAQQITIKINSYIPYFDFYVQFTDRGILFDLQAPEKEVVQQEKRRKKVKYQIEKKEFLKGPEVKALLKYCEEPRKLTEMIDFLGKYSSKNAFRSIILNPLINQGKIKRTIPDKPGSKF